MRVYLHIGPHKTGTTTLQLYLRKHFGSARPKKDVWYPIFGQDPGHVALVRGVLHGHGAGVNLGEILHAAAALGTRRLILSAEDFIHLIGTRKLQVLGEALSAHEVVLMSTQTSYSSRVASLWQEHLKVGETRTLQQCLGMLRSHASFHPHLLEEFASSVDPVRIAIVCAGPGDPKEKLLGNSAKALDLQVPAELEFTNANVSLGQLEAELLRGMNASFRKEYPQAPMPGKRYNMVRNEYLRMFASKEWQAAAVRKRIAMTPAARKFSVDAFRRLQLQVEALSEAWDVRIFGDLRSLSPAEKGESAI